MTATPSTNGNTESEITDKEGPQEIIEGTSVGHCSLYGIVFKTIYYIVPYFSDLLIV